MITEALSQQADTRVYEMLSVHSSAVWCVLEESRERFWSDINVFRYLFLLSAFPLTFFTTGNPAQLLTGENLVRLEAKGGKRSNDNEAGRKRSIYTQKKTRELGSLEEK